MLIFHFLDVIPNELYGSAKGDRVAAILPQLSDAQIAARRQAKDQEAKREATKLQKANARKKRKKSQRREIDDDDDDDEGGNDTGRGEGDNNTGRGKGDDTSAGTYHQVAGGADILTAAATLHPTHPLLQALSTPSIQHYFATYMNTLVAMNNNRS